MSGPTLDPQRDLDADGPTMDRSELQRRAVAGSFWTAVHTLLAAPVAFAVNAVVARVLGPVEYGGLALLMLALALATQVSNLGVSDATIQWGAGAAVRGDRTTVASLLSKSLGFHLAVQLPLLVATVLVLAHDNAFVAVVLVVGVALPAALGSAALLITIESRSASGAKLAMLSNLLVQAAVLVAALTTSDSAWVWGVRALAGSLLLPLNFLLLDRWGRRVARSIAWPRRQPTGFWRFAVATSAGGLLATLVFSRSEIFVLTWFGDAASVGFFALAFGVAAQITAPVDALMGPLAPAAAGLVAAHPDEVRRARDRATRASAFLSGGLLAVVVPPLVMSLTGIYGDEYGPARIPLLVLAATSCLQSACHPLSTFLSARRQAGRLLRMTIVALVVNVALAFSLVPGLGLVGALVANAGGQFAFLCLLVTGEAQQERQGVAGVMVLLRAWGVGLVVALFTVAVPVVAGFPVWPAAALSVAVGLLLYVIGVRVVGAGMDAADWGALSNAMPKILRPAIRWGARVFGVSLG